MNSTLRCLALWGTATTVSVVLVAGLLPVSMNAAHSGAGSFESWLVASCAFAAAGCVTWGWVLVTLVVVDGRRGRPARAGVPRVVRRAVLAACGLSLAGGLAVPVHADRSAPPPASGATQALLVGLPLPDRTTTTTAWIGALTAAGLPSPTPRPQTPRSVSCRATRSGASPEPPSPGTRPPRRSIDAGEASTGRTSTPSGSTPT